MAAIRRPRGPRPSLRWAALLVLVTALAAGTVAHAQVVRDDNRSRHPASSTTTTGVIEAESEPLLRTGKHGQRRRRDREDRKVGVGMGGAYDEGLADAMVDFAAAAYFCRSDACEAWTCSACKRHPHAQVARIYDAKHNGNGFVGYAPDLDVVVISFAGTDTSSIKNWIDDLDGELTAYPWAGAEEGCGHCKVHKGFLTTYQALRPQLLPLVQALSLLQHENSPIWVTGHSLGAALGVLCVLDLLRMGYPVQASINFGQPRVGNRELADYYKRVTQAANVTFYRLVHAQDPVPHLPPESFGFWHPPYEVWYRDESHHRVCNESGEDPHCSDKYILDTSVSDHLHYLGIEFGAAELEGQIAELQMQALAVDRAVVDRDVERGGDGSVEVVVEA